MELDDLKAMWADLDQRLGRLEGAMPPEARQATGVRVELRPLVVGQMTQILAGVLLAVAAGSFWVDHRASLNLLVAGLLLHAYAIAWIVAGARNLVLVGRVRDDEPVLEVQQRLAELRAWRIREGRWFGIVGCFMWVALLVSAFGVYGVDIVAAQPLYIALNLVVAGGCLLVFLRVTRWERAPEGGAVRRARERLDEVGRFRGG